MHKNNVMAAYVYFICYTKLGSNMLKPKKPVYLFLVVNGEYLFTSECILFQKT